MGGLVDLPVGSENLCSCRTINRDFDSKDFQIKAPILYISGEFDPATPLVQARYNFEHQNSSKGKAFLTVKGGGHFGTWNELSTCTDYIFQNAFLGDVGKVSASMNYGQGCAQVKKGVSTSVSH